MCHKRRMTASQLTFAAVVSYPLFVSFLILGDVMTVDTSPEVVTLDYVTSLIPSALSRLALNHVETVQFSVAEAKGGSLNSTALTLTCPRPSAWTVLVRSLDPQIALPVSHQDVQRTNRKLTADARFRETLLSDSVSINDSGGSFAVLGLRLGRCLLSVEAYPSYRLPRETVTDGWCPAASGVAAYLHVRHEYHVTVVRATRSVDVGFNWAVAMTTVVNGLSLGCVSEWRVIKECAGQPVLLLLAASLQLVAMPLVAIALVRILSLGHDLGMGLLSVACLPGGGMAYVIAALANRKERKVDAALNFISIYASTVTFPLWIFLIDRSTGRPRHSFSLFQLGLCSAWLATHAAFHQTGFQLRLRLNTQSVDVFLNWLTKPFLLLYAILISTLGIYINAYTFSLLSWSLLVAIVFLPTIGFLLGTGLGSLTGQRADVVRVLGAEASTVNSALALTVMRFALDSPESDTMAVAPFWVAFSSPVPVLVDGLLRGVAEFCRVRRTGVAKKKEEEGGVEDEERGSLGRRRGSESGESSQGLGTTVTESCVSPLQLTPVEERDGQLLLIVREQVTVL